MVVSHLEQSVTQVSAPPIDFAETYEPFVGAFGFEAAKKVDFVGEIACLDAVFGEGGPFTAAASPPSIQRRLADDPVGLIVRKAIDGSGDIDAVSQQMDEFSAGPELVEKSNSAGIEGGFFHDEGFMSGQPRLHDQAIESLAGFRGEMLRVEEKSRRAGVIEI